MEESWREPWVLLVDDAKQTLCLVAEELREAGCRVWTASDGVEAVEILETERVDIFFTDCDMPRMNGLELIRWSQAHLPHIPAVLMTGHERDAIGDEVWHCGALRILLKPFSIEHLLLLVKELRGVAVSG